MSGDGNTPDRDFACQSHPRNECVLPASRPGKPTFSDVHLYYHGIGADTTYTGSIQLAFMEGTAAANQIPVKITVKRKEPIANHSIVDIVTSEQGTFALTYDLVATSEASGVQQSVREQVDVIVK